VNDFLVTYLDSIDERLLEYLDDDDEVHGPPDFPRRPTGGRAPSIIIGPVIRPLNACLKW
jgi:hypothetical protein